MVVLVAAPPNVLAERIALRARGNDIPDQRLNRTVQTVSVAPDYTIVNVSGAEYHARQFACIVKDEKLAEQEDIRQ
jgi:ribose 1,5-bisphosphokinase